MKLTEEQAMVAKESFIAFEGGFSAWLTQHDFPDPQPTENTCQWIHCSERLPTLDEADRYWEVCSFHPDGGVGKVHVQKIPTDLDLWWTPTPKNLVKPTPPDPFEEWWKDNKGQFPLISKAQGPIQKDAARSAFEAGQSQPK